MAQKVHVISHTTTGAVLAACSRGEGGKLTDVLGQLVGSGLQLASVPQAMPNPPVVAFTIDASVLTLDALDPAANDPFSTDQTSVVLAPQKYSVQRDALTNFQSISQASQPTIAGLAAGPGLTITLINAVPVFNTVPGWIQLVDTSTGTVLPPTMLQLHPTGTGPSSTTCTAAVTVTTNVTYSVLLLVQGCAMLITSFKAT